MINKVIDINLIKFEYKSYDLNLYNSIKSVNVVIPIKIKLSDDKFICVDGNKRLSVLTDLKDIDLKYSKVLCMIVNDFSKSGSSYWGNTRNKH